MLISAARVRYSHFEFSMNRLIRRTWRKWACGDGEIIFCTQSTEHTKRNWCHWTVDCTAQTTDHKITPWICLRFSMFDSFVRRSITPCASHTRISKLRHTKQSKMDGNAATSINWKTQVFHVTTNSIYKLSTQFYVCIDDEDEFSSHHSLAPPQHQMLIEAIFRLLSSARMVKWAHRAHCFARSVLTSFSHGAAAKTPKVH